MITLAHNVASIFGGCDDKGCFKDINIGACARQKPPSPNEIDLICHRRDDTLDTSRDAGRPSTTMSRSLGDSCWSQDCHNRWVSLVLQLRARLRHPDPALLQVVPDVRHDGPTRRRYTKLDLSVQCYSEFKMRRKWVTGAE